MTRNIVTKYLRSTIFIIGATISFLFIVANLQRVQPASYAFAVCIICGVLMAGSIFASSLVYNARKYLEKILKTKCGVGISLLVIALVGIVLRLFFYFHFSYDPISDPMTFYEAGKNIEAGRGLMGDSYIAMFPYLFAYDMLLGLGMGAIKDPWLATIVLNTFFDILSAATLFILTRKMAKTHPGLSVIAFSIWMLNPLNIIFSIISIPVVVVNFFICVSLLLCFLLIDRVARLRVRSVMGMSAVVGIVMGISNCFRPIFLVPVIALSIVFISMALNTNRSWKLLKLSAVSILTITTLVLGIQKIYLASVSSQIGLGAAGNPSGVSLYVGSAWDTSGQWRPYQNVEMSNICQESFAKADFDACHAELRKVAAERYRQHGITNSLFLFMSKLYHQAGEQSYLYNANQSIVGYAISKTSKVMNVYLIIYLSFMFILSTVFLYRSAKLPSVDTANGATVLLLVLVMIGWFMSFVVMESAPRYSTILYPIFTIFSVLAIGMHKVKIKAPTNRAKQRPVL